MEAARTTSTRQQQLPITVILISRSGTSQIRNADKMCHLSFILSPVHFKDNNSLTSYTSRLPIWGPAWPEMGMKMTFWGNSKCLSSLFKCQVPCKLHKSRLSHRPPLERNLLHLRMRQREIAFENSEILNFLISEILIFFKYMKQKIRKKIFISLRAFVVHVIMPNYERSRWDF